MLKHRRASTFCGVEVGKRAIDNILNRTLETFRYELSESGVNAENDIVWVIEIKITEVQKK